MLRRFSIWQRIRFRYIPRWQLSLRARSKLRTKMRQQSAFGGRWHRQAHQPVRKPVAWGSIVLAGLLMLAVVLSWRTIEAQLRPLMSRGGQESRSLSDYLTRGGSQLRPLLSSWLRVDVAGGRSMLAQTLPTAAEAELELPPHLSWRERVRSWLYMALDFDITQPTTYLAAVLPAVQMNTAIVRLPGARPGAEVTLPGDTVREPADVDLVEPSRLDVAVWGDARIANALADVNFAASSQLTALSKVAWGNEPLVLILHTHSSEMYATSQFTPVSSQESHRFNAVDTGVIRVGEVLAKTLSHRYGIPVVHSKEIHDFPSHTLAYTNAAVTIRNLLAKYPSIQIVLDVHRDAAEGASYVRTINGTEAAQVMLVVSELGKTKPALHPQWQKNIQFAQAMQQTLESLYPGMYRPYPRVSARYNQHLHPNMTLLEVGNYEDDEKYALRSAAMMADVIALMLEWTQGGMRASIPEIPVTSTLVQPKVASQPEPVQPMPTAKPEPLPLPTPANPSPSVATKTPMRRVDLPELERPNPTSGRP